MWERHSASTACMVTTTAAALKGDVLLATRTCDSIVRQANSRHSKTSSVVLSLSLIVLDAAYAQSSLTLTLWTQPQRVRRACPLQVPYVVEWALFYRALQGVSHVYVCDHGSTDGADLLTDLFASRGIDGVVVEPAPQVRHRSAIRQFRCRPVAVLAATEAREFAWHWLTVIAKRRQLCRADDAAPTSKIVVQKPL